MVGGWGGGSVCLAGLPLVCKVWVWLFAWGFVVDTFDSGFKNNLVLLKAGLQNYTASGAECAPCPALGFRVILSPE